MWFCYWKWLCDLTTQASAFLSLNISSNFRDVISWSMFIHIWLLYECCISQQTLRLKINADADCCCDVCTWNQHTNIIWLGNQAPSTRSLQGVHGTLHKGQLSTANRYPKIKLNHGGLSCFSGSLIHSLSQSWKYY